jgi:hypothetical protein
MARTCQVPNCGAPASSRYSRHCRRHKSNLRRHGGTTQSGVKKSELAPYCDKIRNRRARNPDSPLWPHLEAVWKALVGDARAIAGRSLGNRYDRLAAHEILNIDADCSAENIGTTALAMFMLWHERPTRFQSDRAFRLQLVRRVRALSRRHIGLRYDPATGRERRLYRELSPKAGAIVAQRLTAAYGAAGLQLGALEDRDRDQARAAAETIRRSIKEMK